MAVEDTRIMVGVPGARETFEKWIASRGGVQVWNNINLSNIGAGQVFTPVFNEDGSPIRSPKWSHERGEVVQDITRFRFVKAWKEVKRFHVAVRMGSQGTMVKLTDASSARVRRTGEMYPGASYRFDYEGQECVFEMPEYED